MIKVLNIISDSNVGGAGRLLVNYLHNFDRTRFDVSVALPRGSELKPFIDAEGYPVYELDGVRDKSFDMKAVKELRKLIKTIGPDIVHTHSAFAGRLASYLTRVPCRFYTRHSAFPPSRKLTTFPGKQINGLVNNRLATEIVAVAQAAKDNLTDTGVKDEKITVIINGVEEVRRTDPAENEKLKDSLGIAKEDFVCGISARLEEYKGHRYLLDTAKYVTDRKRATFFLIIGGGSCEENLKKQAEKLGITDRVCFTGFVKDVAPYYNIMDLNLNCSIGTETSSLALSEGFSLGIPAVATTYGGNPYMVTDGINGFLVPERDSEAMGEKILQIENDRELYEKLSAGARQKYEEKFTAAAMTRQLEALYEKSYREHVKNVR